jgi:DNA topoisomerase VI subunit B
VDCRRNCNRLVNKNLEKLFIYMVSLNVECDENRMRLEVDDSGPGISKKDLTKVFDRFYRVEGSEDKGTGIGLALVKELVDLYRGQLSVNSEPGNGTRFKVSLSVDKNAFNENEIVYGEWRDNGIQIKRPTKKKRRISLLYILLMQASYHLF